ncbi:MAG: 4-amino-4-deoxy-L-arabinose transferase [Candidatus Methanocomedens sp.]|nr:MAG: 4-amino-4-deoxy-L-arabinose transferase [ANME-2 cluster archaeon]
MRQELRKILARVFVALLIFLIGVVIYKQANPYAYPGLENRILFVLVPSGIVLLYLYLEERENRDRLISVIMVTIGRLYESKFMRFCEGIWESNWESNWERSPSLVHVCVSKVLAVIHPYLHKMSGYMLKQDPKQVVSHAFLGMLLIVVLQSVIPQPPLEWAKTPVMIAAVVLGVVTFYLNRDKLGEIEEEARQEEIEEKRREMEFAGKYPRINRVWGVKRVVKWMYKEGWWYSGVLLGILLIGGFLRLWNLGKLSLWGDEGTVYIAAKNILLSGIPYLETGPFYSRDYPHLYITAASLAIIGKNEFALRLPSAIFGVFLIFIIYFLTKKVLVNKQTALLAAGIIATHPWMVEYSRVSRSYIMMVLLLYFSIFYFYKAYYEEMNNSRNLIIFSIMGILTTLTHQIGQLILFLFPLSLPKLKFKKENIKYILPFFSIVFGVLTYRYVSVFGYMYLTDQYKETFGERTISLIERVPFGTPNIDNLGIFMRVVPYFIIFATIGVIFLLVVSMIIQKKKKYNYLPFIFVIFIVTVLFSKETVTINRAILHIFPSVAMLTAFTFIYMIKFIPKTKLTVVLPTLALVFIFAFYTFSSYSTIINRDYGDQINPNYSVFEGFVFCQDHKTTVKYVNDHYKAGDIIIVYQVPQYWAFYGNRLPDYRVWTGTTYTIDGKNIYTGVEEVRDLDKLEEILENNDRVWIVTSYSARRSYRIYHISKQFIRHLNGFENNIVYISNDTSAKVYLIEKNQSRMNNGMVI